MKHYEFLGPFPPSLADIASELAVQAMLIATEKVPNEKRKPFRYISRRELSEDDNEFLLKMLKLDPRERPTAKRLLDDKWFAGIEKDDCQI